MNKTKKFNSIDVLIVLVVLLLCFMIAARYYIGDIIGVSSPDDCYLHFYIEDITPTIKKDGIVIYNEKEIGFVSGEPEYEYEYYIYSEEEGTNIQDNNRVNVNGVISVKGKFTNKGFLLEGKEFIAAGKKMEVIIDRHLVTLTITDVVKA